MARRKRKQGKQRSEDRRGADPVVGYFALHGMEVVCDGDACVIAGTTRNLHKAIALCDPQGAITYSVRRTTASEILYCMWLFGADYALDALAYQRFLAPGQAAGLPIGPEDFSEPTPTGLHFVLLQPSMLLGPAGMAAASW